ncbi:MAG TPA: M20 family metallopeptidase [Terriglobales bacterium]|nr:M20 family metallopeptidase [Terriglobales bacterium]
MRDDYTVHGTLKGLHRLFSIQRIRLPSAQSMKKKKISKQKAKPAPSVVKASSVKPELLDRLRYFEERREAILETTRQLVEIESPSDNKSAVDRLGSLLAGRFEKLGGHSKFHKAQDFGNHLQVDFPGRRGGKPVLLLGHFDTVYPLGTLAKMPCRTADGRLTGPGALDMKSGIAMMLHAIGALRDWHSDALPRPVTVLLVTDEEVGSDSSRRITESLARNSSAVLVLEPSFGMKGAVKTARKGVGEYMIEVSGIAAHSGLDFEKGESAILELARQVLEIPKLIDKKRGLTLNVGLIKGGTRVNVIPDFASAILDVRVTSMKDASSIEKRLRALKPFNKKCKLTIKGGVNRPPMERNQGVSALFDQAATIARQLGWKLDEAAVGGGSDGNFTAGLGIPTLDGMGGVGDGAHATHEFILTDELPRRTALLAQMIKAV